MNPGRTPRRTGSRIALSVVAGLGLLAGTLALADALGAAAGPPGGAAALSTTHRPAPPLNGPTLDGHHADLARLRGQVVVVTVWASWCPPCREELPVLVAARQRYTAHGVTFLGVLTRDSAAPARGLLAETGASTLPSVLDPDGTLAVSWGATGVPETFLVDRSGVVRARSLGPVTAHWLDRQLPSLWSDAA